MNALKPKSIIQYDLEGNKVKVWESVNQATEEYGKNIVSCAKGRLNSAYKFIWRYE